MRNHLLFAGGFALICAPLLLLPAQGEALESLAVQSMLRDLDEGAWSSVDLIWDHPTAEDARQAAIQGRSFEGTDALSVTPHFDFETDHASLISADGEEIESSHLGSRLSLIPPLLAILLAFLFRGILMPLSVGILTGTILAAGFGGFIPLLYEILWIDILGEKFKLYILGFVILLSTMVAVVTRMGGIEGMVQALTRYAKSSRSVQAVAYGLGFGIFFDDYANTIVVGNSCGPLFDRMKVSRAKLAYIVDSTAAPVAGVAVLSTWVAYQISTYSPQLPAIGYEESAGYSLFLETIPFRFYCLFALVMVAMVIWTKRDIGPMRESEKAAREGKDESMVQSKKAGADEGPYPGTIARARNGLLPLAVLLIATGWLLYAYGAAEYSAQQAAAFQSEGWGIWLREVLSATDSAKAIFMGSLAAFLTAFGLALTGRLIPLKELAKTTTKGSTSLIKDGVLVLILAWGIGEVCAEMATANYLVAVFQDLVQPDWLPILLFLTSCFVAFATGSSWTTMAIMQPNVVLLAARLGEDSVLGTHGLLILSIGAVLEGAIFGDHCSPISDTTILSSTATRCKHIVHVKTQAPYALLTAAVALFAGYIPVALWGAPSYASLGLGIFMLYVLLRIFGRPLSNKGLPMGSPST
jgi:Na+/H+ antiporter NhaC